MFHVKHRKADKACWFSPCSCTPSPGSGQRFWGNPLPFLSLGWRWCYVKVELPPCLPARGVTNSWLHPGACTINAFTRLVCLILFYHAYPPCFFCLPFVGAILWPCRLFTVSGGAACGNLPCLCLTDKRPSVLWACCRLLFPLWGRLPPLIALLGPRPFVSTL